MRIFSVSRSTLLLAALGLFLAGLFAGPAQSVSAADEGRRPYFKALGADVFSGGWFNAEGICPSGEDSKYYQDPYIEPRNELTGGIMAFAADGLSPGKGASSDFGALSLGLIQSSNDSKYGFYSGQDKNSLSFTNTNDSGHLGGLWQGESRQSHCIPDYYGTKKPDDIQRSNFTLSNILPNGIYYNSDEDPSVSFEISGTAPVIFTEGKMITVFVNGDTYIDKDITYDFPNYSAANIPKFALVVKGNIYIGPNVTKLDGLYIAQPDLERFPDDAPKADTGIIWTCHPSAPDPILSGDYLQSCDEKLEINGAVIAKQVNLVRTSGNIETDDIAEVINYTPEMVIGGPFFTAATSTEAKVESLISLPPVF